jgi:hypothetical protein
MKPALREVKKNHIARGRARPPGAPTSCVILTAAGTSLLGEKAKRFAAKNRPQLSILNHLI